MLAVATMIAVAGVALLGLYRWMDTQCPWRITLHVEKRFQSCNNCGYEQALTHTGDQCPRCRRLLKEV